MIRYSAKRLARSMLTLFIIITVVFSLLRLMPVEGYFQNYEKMNDAQIQNGLRQLGLLDPLPRTADEFLQAGAARRSRRVEYLPYECTYYADRCGKGACFHDDGRYGALYLAVAGPAHGGRYGAREGKVVR